MGSKRIRIHRNVEERVQRFSGKPQKFYKEPESEFESMHHHDAINLILQRAAGDREERARDSNNRSVFIQPKLKVGSPSDKYEQEADRVALSVMNMSDHDVSRMVPEKTLQAKGTSAGEFVVSSPVESGIRSLQGKGKPLGESARKFFEPRFYKADFSKVRIHQGVHAEKLAREVNARAFTLGHDIVFGKGEYNPESARGKKLMAHELTHVVQQKGAGNKPGNSIQRYTVYDVADQAAGTSLDWKHPDVDDLKVADDGKMAVGEKGSDAWAETSQIDSAEAIFKSLDSDIKLEKGTRTISGKVPQKGGSGSKKTLTEVKVVNRTGGGRADLTADCGTTARQVMGIKDLAKKFSAATRYNGTGTEKYTKEETYTGNPHTTTEKWFENICRKEFGAALTDAQARAKYQALSTTKKDKFDRKYGINKYAKPRAGQAITIDRPGGWNFHYAGVILRSGSDYATIENYPGTGRNSQSWYFEIYGPKSKGQTFYDEWKKSSGSSAMVVESLKARQGKVVNRPHLVGRPKNYKTTKIATLDTGTHVDVIRRGKNWRKVKVVSGKDSGKIGWMMNKFFILR